MSAYACVVSSLCPVYFSSPATLRLPSTTLAIPSQPTHTGRGVSRLVKSRSYRHSGRTDSTHRCCYECYQRSQFTQDNAEPSFLSVTNSLCQFTVPRTILKSPVPTTPMWARLTTVASQQASRSLGYVNNCTSHRLPKLGATSQRASVSCAVHQVGMELQSPVASTNCATPFHDIYSGCQPNISRAILSRRK